MTSALTPITTTTNTAAIATITMTFQHPGKYTRQTSVQTDYDWITQLVNTSLKLLILK